MLEHTPTTPPVRHTNGENTEEIGLVELLLHLRAYLALVWGERRLLLRIVGVSVTIGLLIAYGGREEYSASSRLIPYRGSGAGGSLSGLAGLAGIRLQALGGDQAITADLYPEVAKSLDFRISVAETPLKFITLNRSASTIEYFRDLQTATPTEIIASYTIGLPGKLLAAVRSLANPSPLPIAENDSTAVLTSYSSLYLGLVNTLAERLTIQIDKKTAIITISGTMPDPYAAADLVRIASNRLMERVIHLESRKAQEQFQFIQKQFDRTKRRSDSTQRELASFTDRNRVLMTATSQIDRERLQREYNLAFEVYQQVSRELEQARIKVNQDTPVFTVLEQVTVPPARVRPRRARILVIALLLGLVTGTGVIAMRQYMASVQPQMLTRSTG
jgi:uncharacterized protein involved in exopolysaccharide biosynthesis